MKSILIILFLLTLYFIFSGYTMALTIWRRMISHQDEPAQINIASSVLNWLDHPPHTQRFPIFLQGVKGLLLVSLGISIYTWIQTLPLELWISAWFATPFSMGLPWVVASTSVTLHLGLLLLCLFIGEYWAEKIAVLYPEKFLTLGFLIVSSFYTLLAGIFNGLEKISSLALNPKQKELIHTRLNPSPSMEIRELVADPQTASDIPEPERQILSAVIDFNDMLVQQVTIPRTDVVAVESQTSLQQALQICLDKGLTKLPVYTHHVDSIEGIVHLRDLVLKLQEDPNCPLPVISQIRETLFVPEAVPLHALLHQFRSKHMHMAIVLDEFGGTAGIVTLEDLLEEVFGEVLDPFEPISPSIEVQKDGSFLVDARMSIDDFNDYFHLHLVVPDYKTLAGYVLAMLNRMPLCGDKIEDLENKLWVTVKSMDRLRIEKVLVQFHLPTTGKSLNESKTTS
jgi:CBS domain containing-hemolysin-like protein